MVESDSKNRGFRAIYPIIINKNLTTISFRDLRGVVARDFRSTEPARSDRALGVMSKQDKTNRLSWPWWAPWTLLAVALTSALTVGATLYDIL